MSYHGSTTLRVIFSIHVPSIGLEVSIYVKHLAHGFHLCGDMQHEVLGGTKQEGCVVVAIAAYLVVSI